MPGDNATLHIELIAPVALTEACGSATWKLPLPGSMASSQDPVSMHGCGNAQPPSLAPRQFYPPAPRMPRASFTSSCSSAAARAGVRRHCRPTRHARPPPPPRRSCTTSCDSSRERLRHGLLRRRQGLAPRARRGGGVEVVLVARHACAAPPPGARCARLRQREVVDERTALVSPPPSATAHPARRPRRRRRRARAGLEP